MTTHAVVVPAVAWSGGGGGEKDGRKMKMIRRLMMKLNMIMTIKIKMTGRVMNLEMMMVKKMFEMMGE